MTQFKWRREAKQEKITSVTTDYLAGLPLKEISKKHGLSLRTIYRYLKIASEKKL